MPTEYKRLATYRILELPTDIHFVDLSETYLYMVHFGLEHFFVNRKNCLHISVYYKSKHKSSQVRDWWGLCDVSFRKFHLNFDFEDMIKFSHTL